MSIRNRRMVYRPLIGGVGIFNPNVGRIGTLGMIIRDPNSQARWILSASHVLVPQGGIAADASEPIYQPIDDHAPVAVQHADRIDAALDCAAALIEQAVQDEDAILEIPVVGPLTEPEEGDRVIKSGYATGVTEGRILRVDGDEVEIESPQEYPTEYELSEQGDSGAVWLEKSTCSPVALHVRGNTTGVERAYGIRIKAVFAALNLPAD